MPKNTQATHTDPSGQFNVKVAMPPEIQSHGFSGGVDRVVLDRATFKSFRCIECLPEALQSLDAFCLQKVGIYFPKQFSLREISGRATIAVAAPPCPGVVRVCVCVCQHRARMCVQDGTTKGRQRTVEQPNVICEWTLFDSFIFIYIV